MASQKLNIDIIARDKTKQALGGIRGALGRLKSSIFSVQSAFIGLGAGLVVRNLVTTGKELENLRVRLKFLLKDTNEGAKAFDNMVKFASKVPFSLEEIQAGSGILATVTDNADDLQKMLEITGNVAAVTGLDFRTASEQIQRSFSAGIGAADLFREKGVRNMLGFKAGATVSIEDTVQAFERVFGKEGRFGKATDELANTFEGTLSMIGDKIFNFKKVLLEAGLFDELKNQFGDLDQFLEDNAKQLDDIAISVGKNLAGAITGAVKVGKELTPVIQDIGGVMATMIRGFMELPTFVKEVGLVGAMLFGKKGAVALAGISFIIGRIKELSDLPKIIPISEMDLKTVEDFDKALSSLKEKMVEPTSFLGEDGIRVYNDLTEAQILHNNAIRDQIKILQELRQVEEKRLPHQLELHKGLEIIKKDQEQINDEVKKTLDLRKHMQEIIRDAENKEMQKQNFILEQANRKRMKFNQLINEHKTGLEKVGEKIKEQNKSFDLTSLVVNKINRTIDGVSKGIAEYLVLGKSLKDTFSNFAKTLAVEVLSTVIKIIAQKGVELAIEKLITREKVKQASISKASMFSGAFSFLGGFLGFDKGGAVSKGKPIVVGERGPELFVPNQTGQITQSARGTGNGAGAIVNFNITTVDAKGFDDLLVSRRGTISRIINESVNERGREALI